jgi:hypothetical protein
VILPNFVQNHATVPSQWAAVSYSNKIGLKPTRRRFRHHSRPSHVGGTEEPTFGARSRVLCVPMP